MPGTVQPRRDFPEATIEPLGTRCPKCAGQDTVIVSMGDPLGEERVLEDNEQMRIVLLPGITFASCNGCGTGWQLERA